MNYLSQDWDRMSHEDKLANLDEEIANAKRFIRQTPDDMHDLLVQLHTELEEFKELRKQIVAEDTDG